MISLLIEFIVFILDFFCLLNDDIQNIQNIQNIQKIDDDFLDFRSILKKNLQEEIDNEIEKNDFFKDFNEKWNN